ncbi:MAG: hypothetical protein IJY58_00695 [Alphaproteobacteria bacterium]|nr:hypothetical protein [Alphaproteobacteria bacterium]
MAYSFLSQEEIERLSVISSESFSRSLRDFKGSLAQEEQEKIDEAIKSNDMGKLSTIITGLNGTSGIDTNAIAQVHARIQEKRRIDNAIQASKNYHYIAKKKTNGTPLTDREKAFWDKKDEYAQQVAEVHSKYSKYFKPADHFTENQTISFFNEPQPQYTTSVSNNTVTSSPDFNITNPIQDEPEKTTVPHSLSTFDISNPDYQPEPFRMSNNNDPKGESIAQDETRTISASDTAIEQHYDGLPFGDPDRYDSFTGDSDYDNQYQKEANLRDDAREGKQTAPQSIEDLYKDRTQGEFGYAGDWQFYEKKKTDWLPIFEKTVLEPMKKFGGEKEIGDLIMNVMFQASMMPLEFLTAYLKQRTEKNKEAKKKFDDSRDAAIDNNLKNRGLSRNDLAAQLAHRAKNWILNDPRYPNLPQRGPYSKLEQILVARRDFARSLPRTASGDLDWGKMTTKQHKQYAKYVASYANSPQWKGYVFEMAGVRLKSDEMSKQSKIASQMRVRDSFVNTNQPATVTNQPAPVQTPPTGTRTPEEIKMRNEALQRKRVENIEIVEVGGSLKNPKIRVDGQEMRIEATTLEELKRLQDRLKRETDATKESRAQIHAMLRSVEAVRSGRATTVSLTPTRTRTGNTK